MRHQTGNCDKFGKPYDLMRPRLEALPQTDKHRRLVEAARWGRMKVLKKKERQA